MGGRNPLVLLVFAFSIFGIFIWGAINSNSKIKQKDPVCKIFLVEGDVTIVRVEENTDWAEEGMDLYSGDKLITGSDGIAKLKFGDFVTMVVGRNSIYVINYENLKNDGTTKSIHSSLLDGLGLISIDSSNRIKFMIKTPHIVAGSLGRTFALEVNGGNDNDIDSSLTSGDTTLVVHSGLVSFENRGNKLNVGSGSGAKGDGRRSSKLIKKVFDTNIKLTKYLQNFLSNDALGGTGLSTIFNF